MGRNASAKIVYGVQFRADDSQGGWPGLSEEAYEALCDDLSGEDEEKYGLETESSGYSYGDKWLIAKEDLPHAYDYGSEQFKPEDLKPEKTAEWDEQFKRFCADKGIPFVQPAYHILAEYG